VSSRRAQSSRSLEDSIANCIVFSSHISSPQTTTLNSSRSGLRFIRRFCLGLPAYSFHSNYLPTEGDGRLCFCRRRYVGRHLGIYSRCVCLWTTSWRQFKSDCQQTLSVMIKFSKVMVGGEVCALLNALPVTNVIHMWMQHTQPFVVPLKISLFYIQNYHNWLSENYHSYHSCHNIATFHIEEKSVISVFLVVL